MFENGHFLSYIRLKEKFNLEGRGHFWKYLQIRHCIKKVVPVGQDKSPIECYLKLPKIHHKASRWYDMCPWTNNNGCSNLRMIWEKDLSCTLDEKTWEGILSNTEEYIREARGKFIQYKIIHRYYFTPSRLNRMGLMNNDLCWKCGAESGTLIHALWECSNIFPLWEKVIDYMSKSLNCELPRSPRLCLLGDRTMVPLLNKYSFRILKTGLITCARIILRYWKEPQAPTLSMWKTQMMGNVACEKMLGRLNCENDVMKEKWDNFGRHMC